MVVDAACGAGQNEAEVRTPPGGAVAPPPEVSAAPSVDAGAPGEASAAPAPTATASASATASATATVRVVDAGATPAPVTLPQAPLALRHRVALQANGTPVLTRLPPGATFAALRAAGDREASFGGARGPRVDGLVLASVGRRDASAELHTALTRFANGRRFIQVRAGKVVDSPPQYTTDQPWSKDFADAVGGNITTGQLAAIALWLAGYDLAGATFDTDADGFSFVVTTTGDDCHGQFGSGTAQTVRRLVHLSRKGVFAETGRTVVTTTPTQCERMMPLGRRPEGVTVAGEASTPAAYFARAAKLEAVSVPAFDRLARELLHHGADRTLVARAERARRDEVRHAATMRALARRAGSDDAALVGPTVGDLPVRPLFAVALENAVEGCLLETWAALVATHQALHAASARLRRTMNGIAIDETRHAELARDVDAWCRARLDAEENAAIDVARAEAVAALLRDVRAARPVPSELGEPHGETRSRLVESMIAALAFPHHRQADG